MFWLDWIYVLVRLDLCSHRSLSAHCGGCDPSVPLRLENKITVYPADVVLFEGILVFYTQEVRDMFHMKLFVDTDSDVRLSRRGIDIKEGGLVVVRAFDSQLVPGSNS